MKEKTKKKKKNNAGATNGEIRMAINKKSRGGGEKHGFWMATIVGISYMSAVLFGLLSGYGITGIDIVLPLIMLSCGFLLTFLYKKTKRGSSLGWISWKEFLKEWKNPAQKKSKWGCVLIGSLFALTIVVGEKIEIYDQIFHAFHGRDFLLWMILSFLFVGLSFLLFLYSDLYEGHACEKEDSFFSEGMAEKSGSSSVDCLIKGKKSVWDFIRKHILLFCFILYFLAFLPYYLTFFPGNAGRDTMESLDMILGNIPFTNHHPILFTAIIGVFVKATWGLGDLTLSLGLYTLFQMMTMALFLAYVSKRIFESKTHWVVKGFSVLFFAFHPIVAMYSIYVTKDVLFSECLILLCLFLYDLIKSEAEILKSPVFCVKLTVITILAALLRNNAYYIAIVLLIVLPIVYRKFVRQLLCSLGFAVLFMMIWQGPVFRSMGIEKQSFAEAASIPLQQLGYVIWTDGEFSEEDRAFLEKLMPFERVKEVYQPGYTDPYKFDEAFDDAFLNDHVGEFLTVWSHGLKHHFGDYVKAYLMQTVGYWHYGESNSVCTQGVAENTLGIEQRDFFEFYFGFSLEGIMEKLVLAGRKAPIICIFSSMAMQMLMLLLLWLQYIRRGREKLGLFLLPFFILWGTIMVATPAFCLLRYLYPLFLSWPFFLNEFLSVKQEKSQAGSERNRKSIKV